jgi:hypothetical protein
MNMPVEINKALVIVLDSPCKLSPADVCDPCYTCKDNVTDATCYTSCLPDQHKFCQLIDTTVKPWTARCSCQNRYLPVGSDCVHESVIIGVTTGVVGAVLVALVIVICICTYRSVRNKRKNKDSSARRSSLVHQEFNPAFTTDLQSEGRYSVSADVLEVHPHLTDERSVKTFQQPTDTTDARRPSPSDSSSNSSDNGRKPGPAGYGVASQAAAVAAVAAAEQPGRRSILQYQLEPISGHGDVEELNVPKELRESVQYTEFVPQLQTVDTSKTYVFQRPKVISATTPTTVSAYYHEYF